MDSPSFSPCLRPGVMAFLNHLRRGDKRQPYNSRVRRGDKRQPYNSRVRRGAERQPCNLRRMRIA